MEFPQDRLDENPIVIKSKEFKDIIIPEVQKRYDILIKKDLAYDNTRSKR